MANTGYMAATVNRSANTADHDYYATDPHAVAVLLENEKFAPSIWEPACGEGHISKVLESAGYDVYSSDLIYRGYGDPEPFDFLTETIENFDGDIITNPPYINSTDFCERALDTIKLGHKVAMFLRFTFLGGQARRRFFDKYPPKTVYLFSRRVECAKNGKFEGKRGVDYIWVVWEKGYSGPTALKWVN